MVVDDKTGTASGLPGAALGSQGLFVGMLIAILASQLFAFLMTFDKLKIKMPDSVPAAITTSFNSLIPIVLTLLGVSIGGYAFRQISGQYLTDWILWRTHSRALPVCSSSFWSAVHSGSWASMAT